MTTNTEPRPPASDMIDALAGLANHACKLAAAARLLLDALGECERDADAIDYLAEDISDRAEILREDVELAHHRAFQDRRALRLVPEPEQPS